MEESLRATLLETAALRELVETRVGWGLRSQGAALPAIALHLISGVPQLKMSGPAEWSRDRVQADCWGRTFKAARDVAAVVIATVHGLRVTANDVQLRVMIMDRRSDNDTDDVGPIFRTSLDLLVWHNP